MQEEDLKKEEIVLLTVYKSDGKIYVEHPELKQNPWELLGFLIYYIEQLKEEVFLMMNEDED